MSLSAFANDTFPGTTISGSSGSFVGSTAAATPQTGEPLIAGPGPQHSMWYTWVAPSAGVVTMGTCNPTGNTNTTIDSMVGVYTGTVVTALTAIATNDDTTGCNSTANVSYGSTVSFTATAGTTYRILVDGYATTAPTGTFNFYWGLVGFNKTVTDSSATEGGDTAAFTLSLTSVPTGNVIVTIGASPQCTFAPTTLTFTTANWATAQTVTVTPNDDAAVEGVHSCTPASITAAGGSFNTATTTPPTFTVNDNDGAIAVATTDAAATETAGNTGAFNVVLTAVPTATVTVTIGTSTQCTFAPSSLTFTAANYNVAQSVVATPIDDLIVEGPHTCSPAAITAAGGNFAGVTGAPPTINITDNDASTVTIANTTNGSETGPTNGVMTVTMTRASATNTVIAYSVAGTATSGTDYTALSGSVTVLAGATTATISIPVIDDAALDPGETVIVTLTGITSGLPTLGATLAATNTITDNDVASVTIANTTNGAEAGPVSGDMTVTQAATSSTNTVVAYTVSGTATSGTDYTALSGTVTIPAGATTATISIPVIDDALLDPNETVTVTLTSITSGSGTLGATLVATNTIADNEVATVTIANTTNGAEAGPANGVMTVTQSLASPTNTVIAYSIGGTATSGSDFTALSGTVTILAGATTATISIPVLNDAIVEGPETVVVTLTGITSGFPTLGATLIATNTIADNDSATVTIANTTNGAEAGPANGVMTLTQSAISATDTVIAYSVGGTATSGSDYTALTGTVTILAGSTTATVTIPVVNDTIVETAETVIVTLTGITSGLPTLGATLIATNTIADNDSATVSIANTTNGAEAGPGNGVMTVTQTATSATDTVLAYTISGTATSGSDYTALSGTVTILAGATTATISIPVLDDAVLDPAETVIVTLTSVTSGLATLGSTLVATNVIADNEAATVTIANTTNGAEAGPANGVMTVTQTLASPTNTVISYSVSGTATSGSDYTALSGTVTILAGATTATISIPVLDDAVLDPAETVTVTLTGVTSGYPTLGATLIATNTITDNEAATVTIANTTNGAEAGPANGVMTVTQTLVSPTNTVIAYSIGGTASSGSDYTALSGTVTILAGATTATISIPVINDAVVEGSETVVVTLTGVTSGYPTLGATLIATNTIADNDSATVTIANTTDGAEAGPVNGVMTVTQSAASATNTVIAYTVGGTATSGSDYTALSGSVTILAGSTTATISIPVSDDAIVEGAETVVVTLTSITSGLPTLGATLIATNTIADNDNATVTIANTTNGNETGPVNGVLTVTQTAVSASNTVISYSVGGTATSGSDFTALSGTVTILAGATTATISIPVINDAIVEPTETVSVTLTSISSGLATFGATLTASINILDNDSATVTIANTTDGAEAGPVNGVMTVTQTAVSATNTVIAYSVGGTATSGSDYTALTGTVTIPAGSTTATISIPVINDAIVEGSETVTVTLTTVSSGLATLGATLIATNTIADNDSATVTIASTTNGNEAGPVNGVLTVTQSAVSATNTVIAYSIGGTATSGSDYTALSGTVTILAGSTTATITVPVTNDAIVEPTETVSVTLTSISSGLATLGATLTASINILDNDSATVTIANTTDGAEAGPVNGVMTVTQTAVSATNTVIAYSIGGTATSGSDYTALSGTVTIPAGSTTATITIPIINDAIVETGETVVVTLTSITSGLPTLGATLIATNTIADNDTATVTIAGTTNGNEAGPVNGVFTLTQSAVSATNTVVVYSVGGAATSGSDYTALSGTVTILAGSTTATISIPTLNDAIVETTESVSITLTSVSSGLATLGATLTASINILDNDNATVTIANTTNGAETGPVNGVLTVTQSAVSATNTVIAYSIGGTATSGSDFTALSGTVTILAGSTTATITVPVINDAIVELTETTSITLTSVSSGLATLGATLTASVNITDNDSATVSIVNTTEGAEAGAVAGVVTVTQTAVSSTNTVIAYSVSGTATSGSDFTALSGSVTIPAGSTTATITIPIINDLIVDPAETVIITLSSISSGLPALGAPLTATNTILDNDIAAFTISKGVNLFNIASPGTLNYTITVANTGNIPLTAPVITDSISNGAALTLTSGPTLSSGDLAPLGVLDAGETWVYTATYAVTQANINNGSSIANNATFDTAETPSSTSNTVTTTISQTPLLTILKTASTPGPVPVGTVITYTYKITNAGNMTMTNVAVNDTHNGSGTLVGPGLEVLTTDVAPTGDTTDAATNGSWDTIGPGDVVTFTATYTVTQHDVDYLQ